MVATLSTSFFGADPQVDDIRIQPNPSLDTRGPFLPKVIFAIVVIAIIDQLIRQSSDLIPLAYFFNGSIYLSEWLTAI
jgi:hypothetical protein